MAVRTVAINLGGRGWAGAEAPRVPKEREGETLQFSAKAGIASDYIYRGTTLSDRKPAVGAGVEATYSVALCRRHRGLRKAADRPVVRNHGERRRASDARPHRIRYRRHLFRLSRRNARRSDQRHRILGGRVPRRAPSSENRSASPAATPIRRTSPTPAPGASMRRAGSATKCRPPAAAGHRRLVHRRRRLFLVRQSVAGSRRISNCPPISTGRRA